ncbi:hypothetical protein [Natrinema halophilum]|uniref:Uncharacterized protein n=1 Tax=Natrinema halophilum TaxID=1699371 RepID=A0A7D5H405_9EURY|nr:hypothetical protein [Natrinema halophilum]QLG50251.1 hypothetical protein HYG82_16060 [Natrinema halophilum]
MQPERSNPEDARFPTNSRIAARSRVRDDSPDHQPSPTSSRPDEVLADGGREPGSIESRLEEIDKQAEIVLETVDERDLEATARRAVESYLETIRFEIAAVDHLLERDVPSDDDT